MITSNLKGRLGNQMFQIAAAYALALDNDDSCVFPLLSRGTVPSSHEQIFYVNTILRNVVYGYEFSWVQHAYQDPGFKYKEIPYTQNLLLDGYFQSEQYFAHRRREILDLFSTTSYIEDRLKKYDDLLSNDFVAVHIRRGDYVSLSDVHANLCEHTTYYDAAFDMFKGKKKVFFSDDWQWCYQNFGPDNIYIKNENDVVEMFLFSKMPNKIIANSSFSWWGAWLGENENSRIIAPQKWFGKDNSHLSTESVIPPRWTKI